MSLSSALPTGTVTFLFTDIEGSTQLWERQPDAMRSALARHDQILRDVIGRQGGGVFKTVGDSFCAAFATATDALEAALTAQKALGAEERAGGLRLRVRMALHTGAAEERDGDYFGQALNRVARLLSAAHGGQTLVSAATHQLVRDALPPGVTLGHLGEHRLRDLSRPEQVFQLCHPELPHEFPPLRGMNHPGLPNNLPQQLTSFIGRERELATVKGLLGSHRLVTLAGSGGCGKTRLALQAAADVLEDYPNGAWLVELGSLSDPALVAQAVVSALGLREQAGQTPTQTLAECLKPKTMLLILDNCEHLLPACADLADALLRACPQVTLLASSREALGIAGEQTYRVPSLSVPDPRQLATVESLSGYESVRLFLDRATLSRPDFRLTAPNAPALASVCQRLDGIPLAIEMAAARVRSLSVEEIAGKLDSRFRLLTGGSRTALPRQQTLRALIDWSYSLLNAQEKRLLNRLAVFAGGWTLEAAEQVCVGADPTGDMIEDWEALDLLGSLVDKSMALAETQGKGTRYRLLETVRQYARERLHESGEADAVRAQHRDWCLAFAEAPSAPGEPWRYEPWCQNCDRLLAEQDNLRAAWAWCHEAERQGAEGPEEIEAGFRLAATLFEMWASLEHFLEGRAFLAPMLSRRGMGAATRARLYAFYFAGRLALGVGEYDQARALQGEALATARALSDKPGMGAALQDLAWITTEQGDHQAAHALAAEGLALYLECGDKRGALGVRHLLGIIAEHERDYAAAYAQYEECLRLGEEVGHRAGRGWNLHGMGFAALRQQDYATARTHLRAGLRWFVQYDVLAGKVWSLCRLGELAAAAGQGRVAGRLLGAAEQGREAGGLALNPSERADLDRLCASLRSSLGAVAFADAWAEGTALALDKAIELAQEEKAEEDTP